MYPRTSSLSLDELFYTLRESRMLNHLPFCSTEDTWGPPFLSSQEAKTTTEQTRQFSSSGVINATICNRPRGFPSTVHSDQLPGKASIGNTSLKMKVTTSQLRYLDIFSTCSTSLRPKSPEEGPMRQDAGQMSQFGQENLRQQQQK